MVVISRLREFIEALDAKTFYLYAALFIAANVLVNGLVLVHYYYKLAALDDEIVGLNDDRRKTRKLIATYARVKKHKDEVDKLLSEDPEFKIISYFNGIRAHVGLTDDNGVVTNPLTHIDQGGKYSETILKIQLTNLTMKRLCELLSTIDHDKRIYTKEVEIAKSKKSSKILDVALTIATLEPKAAERLS